MICVIALIVFGVLGIFSVKYRKVAAEAFDCVFRRITLRECQSGLDRRLKNKVVGLVSRKNVKLAQIVVKNFEIFSWFFLILLLGSIFFSARGIYFYAVYGNCNGDDSDLFCIFDALNPEHASICTVPGMENISMNNYFPGIDDDPYLGNKEAKVTIIEFGCYGCPYTKEAEPQVKKIIENYGDEILFVYRDFPLPSHNNSRLRAEAAECARDQQKFWEYHNLLFENRDKKINRGFLINLAIQIGISESSFSDCLTSGKYEEEVQADFEDGLKAGIYGTPTFYINNITVVGPKPYRYFKNIIDSELKR